MCWSTASGCGAEGPFVIACTHLGHMEPLLLTGVMVRPVHWIARVELFRYRLAALVMWQMGAIALDRQGIPVRAMRQATARLGHGEIVGIFPEGRRLYGDEQAIRGGRIKGGVCVIAARAGVPVVPVVMLGVDRLAAVEPWMPGQRTTVRTIVGPAIFPDARRDRIGRRERRHAMTAEIARAFVALHDELKSCDGDDR